MVIACDVITGGFLYIGKIGEKVLHLLPLAVCSGLSYLDGCWLQSIRRTVAEI